MLNLAAYSIMRKEILTNIPMVLVLINGKGENSFTEVNLADITLTEESK